MPYRATRGPTLQPARPQADARQARGSRKAASAKQGRRCFSRPEAELKEPRGWWSTARASSRPAFPTISLRGEARRDCVRNSRVDPPSKTVRGSWGWNDKLRSNRGTGHSTRGRISFYPPCVRTPGRRRRGQAQEATAGSVSAPHSAPVESGEPHPGRGELCAPATLSSPGKGPPALR